MSSVVDHPIRILTALDGTTVLLGRNDAPAALGGLGGGGEEGGAYVAAITAASHAALSVLPIGV
jgi:hypothetical protein